MGIASGFLNSRKFRRLYFDTRPGNSLLLARTDGGDFVVNVDDRIIGRHCYVQQKPADFAKFEQALKLLPQAHTRELLIDVGANIGTICIAAVSRGLFQRAIAIEPEPGNFHLLSTNLRLNSLDDRIDAHNRALAEVDGSQLVFELSTDNHGDHRVRTTDEPGLFGESERKVTVVQSMTLNALDLPMTADNALVWMDVQGYEGAVLAGASRCIENSVPICLEFSPYQLQRAGTWDALLQSLAGAAYSSLADLSDPGAVLPFDVATLESIAGQLGFDGAFTDLLVW